MALQIFPLFELSLLKTPFEFICYNLSLNLFSIKSNYLLKTNNLLKICMKKYYLKINLKYIKYILKNLDQQNIFLFRMWYSNINKYYFNLLLKSKYSFKNFFSLNIKLNLKITFIGWTSSTTNISIIVIIRTQNT